MYDVGDVAYVGQHLLKHRPANVQVLGPLRWDAALNAPLGPSASKRRKKGDRLPTPRLMLEGDDPRWTWESLRLVTPRGEKELQVKVVRNVCWYTAGDAAEFAGGAGPRPRRKMAERSVGVDRRDAFGGRGDRGLPKSLDKPDASASRLICAAF